MKTLNLWEFVVEVWFLVRLFFAMWLDSRNDTAPDELKEGEWYRKD